MNKTLVYTLVNGNI